MTETAGAEPAERSPEGGMERPSSMSDALTMLRRPPAPEAVKFKIQTNPKGPDKSALCVAYIDARWAAAHFNSIPGLSVSDKYLATPTTGGIPHVVCRIEAALGDERIIHEDIGTPAQSDKLDTDMAVKGLYSDAFKRAAVKFGVGTALYAFPQQWIKANQLDSWGSRDRQKYGLSAANLKTLRSNYGKWLKGDGGIFGEPLAHGEVEDAQGDVETGTQHIPETLAPPYGDPASEAQLKQFDAACAYVLQGDFEPVRNRIIEKLGYLPYPAIVAVGLLGGALKAQREAAAEDTNTPKGGNE